MLTMEVVKELCRAIALENTGLSDDSLSEEVSGIVYRCDVVDCGDVVITDRHAAVPALIRTVRPAAGAGRGGTDSLPVVRRRRRYGCDGVGPHPR